MVNLLTTATAAAAAAAATAATTAHHPPPIMNRNLRHLDIRKVTVGEARELVGLLLADFEAHASQLPLAEREMWTWRDVVTGAASLQFLKLLEALPEGSLVYAARGFNIPQGHEIKPSWVLGKYLELTQSDLP